MDFVLKKIGNILLKISTENKEEHYILFEKDGKYGYLILDYEDYQIIYTDIQRRQHYILDFQNRISWYDSLDDIKKEFKMLQNHSFRAYFNRIDNVFLRDSLKILLKSN